MLYDRFQLQGFTWENAVVLDKWSLRDGPLENLSGGGEGGAGEVQKNVRAREN